MNYGDWLHSALVALHSVFAFFSIGNGVLQWPSFPRILSDVQRSIAGSGLYNNMGLVRHDAWTGGQTNSEKGEQSTQPQWSIE
jgi:hypothetical protein